MTTTLPILPATVAKETEIFYPSSDGEPLAESYAHLNAILTTLQVLTQYLAGIQATVLADQFLYYSQGYPNLRVAPDVMVIFDVAPGDRDNYKIWEEGQVPSVIFEMTSPSTKNQDLGFKKTLYEQLGVHEYWLFDPRGEWLEGQLQGYRLVEGSYRPITDYVSEVLGLRLEIEGKRLVFYRQDTGERLLISEELRAALETEKQRAEAEKQKAEAEKQRAERFLAQLRALGVEPEE